MNKSWDNKLNNMESDISDLTDKLRDMKLRYRGIKRLIEGKNSHIIFGSRQNRLKIFWKGKSFWYHLPFQNYKKSVEKIRSDFIDKVLSGEIL